MSNTDAALQGRPVESQTDNAEDAIFEIDGTWCFDFGRGNIQGRLVHSTKEIALRACEDFLIQGKGVVYSATARSTK